MERTILVVEDDPSNLSVFHAALESDGYHVLTAVDRDSALRACRSYKQPIDLLLADVVLGKQNGADVAHEIVQGYPVPVLFVSGTSQGELERQQRLRLSAFASEQVSFLEKPFTVNALLRSVSQLLGQHVREPSAAA